MKELSRQASVTFKGPLGSPDSENVDTRGIESNISDTNNGGSTEACRRGLERGLEARKSEDGKMEIGEKKERGEGKNETEDDKRSSWSRNLGKSTVGIRRVPRATETESIQGQGKAFVSLHQDPTKEYQKTLSCDRTESRSAIKDKNAAPRGAGVVEPGHSEEKRMLRGGAGYASEGELGRQETQSGRRTCAPPTLMISQDVRVDGATSQSLADLSEPDDGNGGVMSSRKSSQVAFENGNRSGDSRVRARMCSCSGETDGCADGKEECMLAPVRPGCGLIIRIQPIAKTAQFLRTGS